MAGRQFVLNGTAVVKKIKISQAARRELQNIAISVDTSQINRALNVLGTRIQQTISPLQRVARGANGVNRAANAMSNLGRAAGGANRNLQKTRSLFFEVIRKASAFRVSTIFINSFFNAFQQGLKFTIEFDAALRNINKILRVTDSELTGFGKSLIAVAKDFNLSAEVVAQGARTAAQAGIAGKGATSGEQQAATLGLIRKAALLAATSTLEFEQALETLLAVSKQTDSSISSAAVTVAKFAAVEDAAAVDAAGLAEVFKRAGTTLSQNFGPKMNDAIGLISAVAERSRQSSSVVGTFFKTLGARLSGANSEALSALKELNIEIQDSNGNLKNLAVLLGEVGEATKGLGAEDLGAVLGRLGGVRQAELFKVALESVRGGRAQELSEEASKGVATQTAKARQEADKFETSMNRVQQVFNDIINDLKDGPLPNLINELADGVESVVDLFEKLGKAFGGIGELAQPAAILGGGFLTNTLSGGAVRNFTNQNNSDVGTLFGLKKEPFDVLNKRLVTTTTGMSYFGRSVQNINQRLPAFSAQALVASLVFTKAGQALQDAGEKASDSIGGKLAIAAGGVTEVFGTLLPLGAKAATLGTLFTIAATKFQEAYRAFDVAAGDREATKAFARDKGGFAGLVSEFLPNITIDVFGKKVQLGGQSVSTEDAKFIEDQINREQRNLLFSGGAIGDNQAQADLLASKFSAIVEEAAATFNTKNGADLVRQQVSDFIALGLNEVGEFQNLADLVGIKEFASKFDGDLKDAFIIAAQEGASLNEVITDAALELNRFRNALKPFVDTQSAITKTQLENELKLIETRRESSEAIINLFKAEQDAFNTSTGSSTNVSKTSTLKFETELAKERIQAIQDANNAIRQREGNRLARIVEGERAKFIEQERQIARLTNKKFSQSLNTDAIDVLNRRIVELQKVAQGTADRLSAAQKAVKEGAVGAEAERDINKNLIKERAATINLIKQEIAARSLALLVQKEQIQSNLKAAQSFAQQQADEVEAQRRLQAALIGGRSTPAGRVADVQAQSEAEQNLIKFKLASTKAEIEALKEINQLALENRKIDKQREIDGLKSTLTGKAALDVDALAGIARAEKELESIGKIQVKNNEQITSLIKKQFELESKYRTSVLDGLRKELEAARQLEKKRVAAAGKLLDATRKIEDSIKGIINAQKGLTDAIRSKLDEAAANIKSKRGALDSAFSSLAAARKALIDGLTSTADAYANFNVELAKAGVAADKVLGRFSGIREQASALSVALNSAIDAAAKAGASEENLANLRRDAAEQQLQLFQQLLSDTQSKAQRFFTSSADDRQGFVQGLAAIQQISGQFGGNIENFRGLSESQLNDFGRSLISLPQQLRQNIVNALDQLPDGVDIAGLTADEIREVIQGGALGESQQTGIERLSDTIITVADLTRKVAELNTASLVSQQKSLAEQQAAVAEAREGVLIAKNALLQAKIDAQKTQSAIGQVVSTLNSRVGELRDRLSQDIAQVNATYKTDAAKRLTALAELKAAFLQGIAGEINNTAGLVGAVTPDSRVERVGTRLPGVITGSNSPGRAGLDEVGRSMIEANNALKTEIAGLTATLKGNFADNMNSNVKALEELAIQLRQQSDALTKEIEAKINIDNTQNIKISGVTEIVEALKRELEKKDFLTEADIKGMKDTITKLMQELIGNGTIRPGVGLGG